jgi:hypothetical protein
MKKNQNGFSAIECLLLIIVAAIIGGVGYYVYHAHHKPKSHGASTATTTSSPKAKSASQAPNPTAVLLKRTQYIDTYDSQQIGTNTNASTTKRIYADLNQQDYITDTFAAKLSTYAGDYDGLECVATGIIPQQSYAPATISGLSATLAKVETYANPNYPSPTSQNVTYTWVNENDTWKLSGVTCQYS